MILRDAIEQYILWRRAHGAKFTSGANILRRFLGYAHGDAACDAVATKQVLAFLAGDGPLTRHRENQVLRPCRLLAPCDQPRPCKALSTAGQ